MVRKHNLKRNLKNKLQNLAFLAAVPLTLLMFLQVPKKIQEINYHNAKLSLNPLESEVCRNYTLDDMQKLNKFGGKVFDKLKMRSWELDNALSCVNSYDSLIQEYDSKHMPEKESRAIIFTESRGRTDSVSPTGCAGLFQIAKSTFKKTTGKKVTSENDLRFVPEYSFMARDKLAKEAKILGDYDISWRILHHHTGMPNLQEILKQYIKNNIGEAQFEKDFNAPLKKTVIGKKVISFYEITYPKVKSDTCLYYNFCKNKKLDPNFVEKILISDGFFEHSAKYIELYKLKEKAEADSARN